MAKKWVVDARDLLMEIERIYDRHYSRSNIQCVHDIFNAIRRRIRRYGKFCVVEVVRCKDCKHGIWDEYEELWKCVEAAEYDEEYGMWGGFVSYNKAEHYCSYGERRTDEIG